MKYEPKTQNSVAKYTLCNGCQNSYIGCDKDDKWHCCCI